MNSAEEIKKCNILLGEFENLIDRQQEESEKNYEINIANLVNSFRVEFFLYKRKEMLSLSRTGMDKVLSSLKRSKNYFQSKRNIKKMLNTQTTDKQSVSKNVFILGFNEVHLQEMSKELLQKLNAESEINATFLTRELLISKTSSFMSNDIQKIENLLNRAKYLFPKIITFLNQIETQVRSNEELEKYKGIFNTINEVILPRLKEIIIFNLLVKELISQSGVKVIVSIDHASWLDRTVINYCNEMEIPSLGIQQGMASKEYPEFFDLKVKRFCCAGKAAKEGLIYSGYSMKNIHDTGLINQSKIDLVTQKIEKKVKQDKFKILVIGQYYNSDAFSTKAEKEMMYLDVLKQFSTDKAFDIFYKAHPFESILKFKIYSLFKNFSILEKRISLEEAVKMSNFVIVCSSTSVIEAIKQEKEIILLSPQKVLKHQHFSESSLGKGKNIKNVEDVSKIIQEIKVSNGIVDKQNYKEFLDEFFGPIDGMSEHRIAQTVKDLL